MYHITIKLPRNHKGGYEAEEAVNQIVEQIAGLGGGGLRELIWQEAREAGYNEGYAAGLEDGYAEAKVFTVVARPPDPHEKGGLKNVNKRRPGTKP